MNPFKVAITWLLTKHVKEDRKLSEPLNDSTGDQPAIIEAAPAVADAPVIVAEPVIPLPAAKEGVQDFEKAFQFVAAGVAKLGSAAESELIALAKKYL